MSLFSICRLRPASLAFTLATAMTLGLPSLARAALSPVSVVDNLDSPVASDRVSQTQFKAQAFMTGDATHVLHAVELHLADAGSSSQALVEIRLDAEGLPGSVLATLDAVDLVSGGLQTYHFITHGETLLAPNTKYWVVLDDILGEIDWAVKTASSPGILDEEAVSEDDGATWSSSDVPNRFYLMRVIGCLVPRLTVMDGQTVETDGATQLNFEVNLSGPPGEDATVLVSTSNGTATGGVDFIQQIGQPFVFLAGGSTTQMISIPIIGDQAVEDDETFSISLAVPSPARLILDQSAATGTIVDDDLALFDDFEDGVDSEWTHYSPVSLGSFIESAGCYRIQAAASSNPAVLKPGRAASVRTDLQSADFAIGVEVKSWDPALDQGFGFIARSGTFALNQTDGYLFLYYPMLSQAQIIRLDNEFATTIGSVSVTLDPSQDYWFTFSGTGDSLDGEIFQKDDLGTALASVSATDHRIAFGIAGLYATARPPLGTSAVDVTFDNYLAAPVIPPLLAVRSVSPSHVEGASGMTVYSFEVTRGGAVNEAMTVDWEVSAGGAGMADAADFGGSMPAGVVSFAGGETSRPISISVVGDLVVELDEGFQVALTGATDQAVILERVTAGTILNDDSATLNLGFGANALQVHEGRDGIRTAVTALRLDAPVDTGVEVTISTGDFTATAADNDYAPRVGQVVTIAPNETFLPVAIAIHGDTNVETEFEVLQLRVDGVDAAGRGVALAQSVTSISIVNDDIGVNITGGPAVLTEGSGAQSASFSYSLLLTATQTRPVDLFWSVAGTGDHPTDASDFDATSGMVSFPSGKLDAPLEIPVTADFGLEPLESFELMIGSSPASPGAQSASSGAAAPVRRIGLQGPAATLGASGGLDGSGRLLAPDGTAAADGSAIALATFGVAADPSVVIRQLQDGSALMNYDSLVAGGQLREQARFTVDSSFGHGGAFNGSASVSPAAIPERVFIFAFNTPVPGDATAGGVFGQIENWFMPAAVDELVSLDARVVGQSYWGQLIPSTAVAQTFDMRMAPLPGQPGLIDVVGSTVSGRIANDDEIAGIGRPDMAGSIAIHHAGLPNELYDVQFSDNLIDWFTFDSVSTDEDGMGSYTELRIDKIGIRFYRFRLAAP